ncbi:MAG TPA: TIGR02147 family protein [Fibrobacteraceae bacterium]|nr:TIGR02147 family protein [Fibrobacteraceae bacterium]
MATCLLQSLDYRAWLKARSEEIKQEKPYFSYRYLAMRLEVDSGHIARVFTGQAHLALKHLPQVATLFGLDARETEYLGELIRFCRARTDSEAQIHFDRLQTIRGLDFRTVADDQEEYFCAWYHMALRSLLSIADFRGKTSAEIGARLTPPISAKQVQDSIALLKRLKLIEESSDGNFRVLDTLVSTGDDWQAQAIRSYQRQMILMGADALDRFHKAERDISSLTLPFSRKTLPVLRDRLREFRQEMLKLSQDCNGADSLYQVNIQLFPAGYLLEGESRDDSADR